MGTEFKQGDTLVCLNNGGIEYELRSDVPYTAIKDQEEGILPGRPLITVTAPHLDRPICCHASRFVLHDGEPLTREKLEQLREQYRLNIWR